MIAKRQEDILTTRINTGGADLILGSDAIVASSKESMIFASEGRTKVILNEHSPPTAEFILKEGWINPANSCAQSIRQLLGAEATLHFDAHAVALQCLGDSIYVNPIMLGYAWQKGLIPLALETIMRAFELNGVSVQNNQRAFTWGRHCAHDWLAVRAMISPTSEDKPAPTIDQLISERSDFLKSYQNTAYAKQYEQLMGQVRVLEQKVMPHQTQLTETVAKNLFKLMAYKDEYEVARLHLDATFHAQLQQQFKGPFTIRYHLAPPVFAAKNERGELIKSTYGSWMRLVFKVLARLKVLRGTAFDPFAHTEERIQERAWIGQYQSFIQDSLSRLNQDNYQQLLKLAKIPENIKGYGHIKARRVAQAQNTWNQTMSEFNKG
jgi:indolepyruvate ferredoxin oxidoreductase